jgi:hypothetical protein
MEKCPWCGEIHVKKCELQKKYCVQDATWASRMWNKEGTDYMDLSG